MYLHGRTWYRLQLARTYTATTTVNGFYSPVPINATLALEGKKEGKIWLSFGARCGLALGPVERYTQALALY